MLSVVIPAHKEESNPYFHALLQQSQRFPHVEWIFVSDANEDATRELIERHDNVKLVVTERCSRARRLYIGAWYAVGDLILLHHPRSLVFDQGLNWLAQKSRGVDDLFWGGFRHQFDRDGLGYLLTSWYSNQMRLRFRKIAYLDHCIFIPRRLLHRVGVLPDYPIFEDTELSKALRKYAKPVLAPHFVTTWAIRFEQNGFWKQGVLNQCMKLGYHLYRDPHRLNDVYERRIKLNQ